MSDDTVRDDIAQLEDRIEALTVSIERCRKVSLAAKIATAAGAAGIVLMLLWVIPFYPSIMVASLAAVLGGIVLLGSNATTWTQMETARNTAEATRAEMIGSIALRVVGEGRPTIH
jgi:hypothetical protein